MNLQRNKKLLIIISAILTFAIFVFSVAGVIYITKNSVGMSVVKISTEKAIETAIKNAGITMNDVIHYEYELDFDGRNSKYEIELQTREKIYEYDIHAINGKIIYKEVKPTNIKFSD